MAAKGQGDIQIRNASGVVRHVKLVGDRMVVGRAPQADIVLDSLSVQPTFSKSRYRFESESGGKRTLEHRFWFVWIAERRIGGFQGTCNPGKV